MRDVSIRDYIGEEKEIPAAEVRKLPAGTVVRMHSFDRWGNHQWLDMEVYIGTGKFLRAVWNGERIDRAIKKETDRMCYTEVTE